jgi:hypothetical protein
MIRPSRDVHAADIVLLSLVAAMLPHCAPPLHPCTARHCTHAPATCINTRHITTPTQSLIYPRRVHHAPMRRPPTCVWASLNVTDLLITARRTHTQFLTYIFAVARLSCPLRLPKPHHSRACFRRGQCGEIARRDTDANAQCHNPSRERGTVRLFCAVSNAELW